MRIGNIDLGSRPVMLAPMEDVTDPTFRLLCKEQGADVTYTEFVSADALIRNVNSTLRKLRIDERERPTAIQIYGRNVEAMVEAAKIAEDAHPDFLDINCGCPVKKVAGKGAGAGLLRDLPLMYEIVSSVVKAVKLPVTVKTRLGWDHDHRDIVEIAERLQDCGIAALSIHGRTRSQMYTGTADWTLIGEVKRNPRITIPIIGNGDIATPAQALDAFSRYGVDGIMIGRASIGAPWIFAEVKAALTGIEVNITPAQKMAMLRREIAENISNIDEYRGILHSRRHLAATPLLKGIPNFRDTRVAMLRADRAADLLAILDHIETDILPHLQTTQV